MPGTSRRIIHARPESEHQVLEMPGLRVVDPALWDQVSSRHTAYPTVAAAAKRGCGPKFPPSGLLRRGECESRFIIAGHDSYRCNGYHGDHTACGNNPLFRRQEIEDAVRQALCVSVLTRDNVAYVEATARKLVEQATWQRQVTAPRRSAEVVRLDVAIEELRTLPKSGKVRPKVIQPSLVAAEERRAGLLATRNRSPGALPGRASVAITRTADRMRDDLEKLCQTSNPAQARTVRTTVGKLLMGSAIVLNPSADGAGLVGDVDLEGMALLAEAPAVRQRCAPGRS